MAFTYAQLRDAINVWINKPDIEQTIPIFIRLAEERILKSVQLSLFQKNATTSISASSQYLPVPADFLAPMALSLRSDNDDKVFVEFKDLSFVQSYTPDPVVEGVPRYYAQFDNSYFLLAPTPDTTYTAQLQYLYRPASLVDGGDDESTWLSTNAEVAMLYGALVEANTFLQEDPALTQMYQSRFQEALAGLKLLGEAKQSTDEYRTGELIRRKT